MDLRWVHHRVSTSADSIPGIQKEGTRVWCQYDMLHWVSFTRGIQYSHATNSGINRSAYVLIMSSPDVLLAPVEHQL